jgi:hypothetical protein
LMCPHSQVMTSWASNLTHMNGQIIILFSL